MFLPKVYQLLLKILQKKQVVYYNRYISIQNNESEDLIMSERKDPPEFTPKTCPLLWNRCLFYCGAVKEESADGQTGDHDGKHQNDKCVIWAFV